MISLNDLLALPAKEFVSTAYDVLYGRRGDPEGSSYYMNRLALGYSRQSILKQMMRSTEFKPARIDAGANDWRALVQKRKPHAGARLVGAIHNALENGSRRRFERRIEFQYQMIADDLRIGLHGGLAEVMHQVSGMGDLIGRGGVADLGHENAAGLTSRSVGRGRLVDLKFEAFEGVSPSAKDIYLKLRRAGRRQVG